MISAVSRPSIETLYIHMLIQCYSMTDETLIGRFLDKL